MLLPLLCIVAFLFVSTIFISTKKKHTNVTVPKLPPGPKPWPIIGNLNLIGPIPHRSLHDLSQKYGELMQLKYGKFPVVVASSPEMAKQFLKVHDCVFASRPPLAAGKYTAYNYSDMTWAPYGPFWQQARKIYLNGVFNARTLRSYHHIRIEERQNFLSRLHALAGKKIVMREHLTHYTLACISRMVFSNKYFSENEHEKDAVVKLDELQAMLDEWFLLGGVLNIGDWIPWLDFLDVQGYVKRMKALFKKMDRFNSYVIDDHQAKRAAEGKDFVPTDLVDSLLQQAEDPGLDTKLISKDNIKGLLQDLLTGGTDTSATTIEWAVHELLRHPDILERAKEQLDIVIGRNRLVGEDDYSKLPYIEAIIMESLRLHPLSIAPHYATESCNVSGYDISKGTTVIVNTWSIGRDPKIWDNPEEFLPERFIGKETDMLGSDSALLPFGLGRRRCPGYSLGLKLVRTTLANLIHGFNWKLPEGMTIEDVSLEELHGLTTRPKVCVEIIMEPRLNIHY